MKNILIMLVYISLWKMVVIVKIKIFFQSHFIFYKSCVASNWTVLKKVVILLYYNKQIV